MSGVTITTYTMIAFTGKRSEESTKVMDQIRSREWGLLLMDEVHVVPAQMFRKVGPAAHGCSAVGCPLIPLTTHVARPADLVAIPQKFLNLQRMLCDKPNLLTRHWSAKCHDCLRKSCVLDSSASCYVLSLFTSAISCSKHWPLLRMCFGIAKTHDQLLGCHQVRGQI